MVTEGAWRERLVAFYAVYNPSCVNSVDAILSTYKGREDDLLKVLVAKYGPEPSSSQSMPSVSMPRSTSFGSETARRSETPLELLAKRDDETKPAGTSAKLPSRNESHETNARTAEALISSLVKRYVGPDASVETSKASTAVPPQTNPVMASSHQQPWRQRFYNFFSYYRPDKLSELDQKLARHEGREIEWMQSLLLKYGPEPPPRKFLLPPVAGIAQDQTHRDVSPAPRGGSGIYRPQISTALGSSLASPSPPSHPVYQPVLAQRFQNPVQVDDVSDANHSHAEHLSEVVTKLTGALEQKTRELLKIRGDKVELEELLQRSKMESNGHKHEVEALEGKLSVCEKQRDEAIATLENTARQQTRLTVQIDELASLRSDHANISRTLASREHQCRSQRIEIDQINQELLIRERQLAELSATLRELHVINKGLVDSNSALQLALVEPGSESRFHKVVEDIQDATVQNFNHRRKVLELEMQQYYEYAKHQIEQRDFTIRALSDQLSTITLSSGEYPPRVPNAEMLEHTFGENSREQRALAEEVARLKLQLLIQSEEHKALLDSHRRASGLAPPSLQLGDAEVLRGEVEHLRLRLRQTEDESTVAKEALQSELRRQVEDMKDIHERVDSYEREKSHLIQTINDLKAKSESLSYQPSSNQPPFVENARNAPSFSVDNSFTRSNVWSLLYER